MRAHCLKSRCLRAQCPRSERLRAQCPKAEVQCPKAEVQCPKADGECPKAEGALLSFSLLFSFTCVVKVGARTVAECPLSGMLLVNKGMRAGVFPETAAFSG